MYVYAGKDQKHRTQSAFSRFHSKARKLKAVEWSKSEMSKANALPKCFALEVRSYVVKQFCISQSVRGFRECT